MKLMKSYVVASATVIAPTPFPPAQIHHNFLRSSIVPLIKNKIEEY